MSLLSSNAYLAQLGERKTEDLEVAGSIQRNNHISPEIPAVGKYLFAFFTNTHRFFASFHFDRNETQASSVVAALPSATSHLEPRKKKSGGNFSFYLSFSPPLRVCLASRMLGARLALAPVSWCRF